MSRPPTLQFLEPLLVAQTTGFTGPLFPNVEFRDDDGDFDGATFTLTGLAGTSSIAVAARGGITLSGTDVVYDGQVIATTTGLAAGAPDFSFTEHATAAAVQALMRALDLTADPAVPSMSLGIVYRDAAGNAPVSAGFEALALRPYDRDEYPGGDPVPRSDGYIGADPVNWETGLLGKPALGDFDGDGDLDLVIGSAYGMRAYTNDGNGNFVGAVTVKGVLLAAFEGSIFNPTIGSFLFDPAAADLNGDGVAELLYGTVGGQIVEWGSFAPLFGGASLGELASPAFGDLDGDGTQELIVGLSNGTMRVFDSATGLYSASATITEWTGTANPLAGITAPGGAAPTFFDLDNDGDDDLLLVDGNTNYSLLRNDGASFAPLTGIDLNALSGGSFGGSVAYAIGDINGDGFADILGPDQKTVTPNFDASLYDPWASSNAIYRLKVWDALGTPVNALPVTVAQSLDENIFRSGISGATSAGYDLTRLLDTVTSFSDAPGSTTTIGKVITTALGEPRMTISGLHAADAPLELVFLDAEDRVEISSLYGSTVVRWNGETLARVTGLGTDAVTFDFQPGAVGAHGGFSEGVYYVRPGVLTPFLDTISLRTDGDTGSAPFNLEVDLRATQGAPGQDLPVFSRTLTFDIPDIAEDPVLRLTNPFDPLDDLPIRSVHEDGAPLLLSESMDVQVLTGAAGLAGARLELTSVEAASFEAVQDVANAAILAGSPPDAPLSGMSFTVLPTGDGPGQVGVTGTEIRYEGAVMASLSQTPGGPFTVTFAANASEDGVEAILSRLAYSHGAETLQEWQALFFRLVDSAGRDDFGYRVIDLVNRNDAPAFLSPDSVEMDENGVATGLTLSAQDPDVTLYGQGFVSYSLSGTDAALFEIVEGALRFRAAPDFEAPADADGDNVYDLTVTASDGAASTPQAVSVTVRDVNEAPVLNVAPTSVSVAENSFTTGIAMAATDPDGDGVTIGLSGADAGLFQIVGGALAFRTTFDFEAPTDADRDNVYEVTVTASDGTLDAAQSVAVTVTDVNEAPVAFGDLIETDEDTAGSVQVLANDSDPDMPPAPLRVTQLRDGATGTVIALGPDFVDLAGGGRVRMSETGLFEFDPDGDFDGLSPAGGLFGGGFGAGFEPGGGLFGEGGFGEDGGGSGAVELAFSYDVSDGSLSDTGTITVSVSGVNDPPVMLSPDRATVDENTTAPVLTLFGSDPDESSLIFYQITGGADRDAFRLDGNALSFVSAPDFEAPTDANGDNVYAVQVSVFDGTTSTPQDITVTVRDVAEATHVDVPGGAPTGTDRLVGTAADERFDGKGGPLDFFTGGAGGDVFVFTDTAGRDTVRITDYDAAEGDVIDLQGASVLRSVSGPAFTIVTLDGGEFDTLILDGVTASDTINFV